MARADLLLDLVRFGMTDDNARLKKVAEAHFLSVPRPTLRPLIHRPSTNIRSLTLGSSSIWLPFPPSPAACLAVRITEESAIVIDSDDASRSGRTRCISQ